MMSDYKGAHKDQSLLESPNSSEPAGVRNDTNIRVNCSIAQLVGVDDVLKQFYGWSERFQDFRSNGSRSAPVAYCAYLQRRLKRPCQLFINDSCDISAAVTTLHVLWGAKLRPIERHKPPDLLEKKTHVLHGPRQGSTTWGIARSTIYISSSWNRRQE